MTNRDLLKEAIADAKAVKETAIANAKLALEETFNPFLKERLAAVLAEMDEREEEAYSDNKMKEGEDKMDEDMDLEELLRELDEMDSDSLNEVEDVDADGVPDEMDSDVNIEDMSIEDLESFIKEVIADMISAGELEAGEEMEGEEMEMDDDEGEMEMEEMEGEDINIEEMVAEIKKAKAKKEAKKEDKDEEKEKMKKELKEVYDTLRLVKSELNEVNLFNAKLLYTNKIFRNKNLSESQKVKVLAAFDKAVSVKEAKLVYETLSEGLKQTKAPVNESLLRGAASKVSGIAPKKPILEVNDQVNRWQILAGIKKL